MTLRRDAFAALFLFVVFAVYGMQATQIAVFPGQELEPFKPRTMPYALALAGMLLCVLRILQTLRAAPAGTVDWGSYDWKRAAILCLVMLGYGFLFNRLGFIIATTLFLLAGFFTLGERRISLLLILPVTFSFLFWLTMTELLDLYLATGDWWPVAAVP
jgi:putative tricarboxylic transport membrane protein